MPDACELKQINGVRFSVIKNYEPETDGFHWLKGTAIARHLDRWIVSFGHNTCETGENNSTEVANGRISKDEGRTWGPVFNIDAPPGELAVSHGVFLQRDSQLWGFMGAFYGKGRPGGRVHTRAYTIVPESVEKDAPVWENRGVVAWDGFWPLQEALLMDNGQYIVAGASVGGGDGDMTIPAVALVDGRDLTQWEVVKIPPCRSFHKDIWGESTVIVNRSNVLLISRSNPTRTALVSRSEDYGRSWGPLRESNLPMAASKPYAGTLSTGHNYLINTICGDARTAERNPLSIALTRPGEMEFRKLLCIIDSRRPPTDAGNYSSWPYPYAVEHDDCLWVSFYMGSPGHGSGAAGLAVVPIEELVK